MCGRYGRLTAAGVFAEMIGARLSDRLDDRPGVNLPPGLFHPIALRSPDDHELVVGPAWWSFTSPRIGTDGPQPPNARSETAHSNSMFKRAFRHQRCAIPLDWWIEWDRSEKPKQPYALRPTAAATDDPDSSPFFLAGIWSKAPDIEGFKASGQVTYAVLTKTPHDDISFVHDRQPVTLTPNAVETWLSDTDDLAVLRGVVHGGDYNAHTTWPISSSIGNVRNQGLDLVEPVR